MKKKGQVSIEFLLIFMFALIYIYSVVQPGIEIASASFEDVSNVSQARLAAEKLANSVNELFVSQGEAKKTIHLLVPEKAKILCDTTVPTIKFESGLSERLAAVTGCDATTRVCTGSIRILSSNITCPTNGFEGKKFFEIQITKDTAGAIDVR